MSKPTISELLKMARSEDRDDAFDGAAEMAERVEAVIMVHWKDSARLDGYCGHCLVPYPCMTIQALNGEP